MNTLTEPPATTSFERAATLLADVRDLGWIMDFLETSPTSAVHVMAADADQVQITDVIDWLLCRRFTTVCGRQLFLSPLEGTIGVFDDDRLCQRCRAAFPTDEDRALIFEHNTDDLQNGAPTNNEGIRAGRRIQADREKRLATTGGDPR